ncbi:acetylcholine-gated chloride channel subunit acc-1-like [Hyalella azteca]|uniref:Acetylcholine-gated chloride channel subunit acc-1-like n=1 Tax=Hyalella azteca TaxID=294128 RepID=A0A8B7N3D3_HYAAZ|nr:acetylcholine-gated chloride channel subunit acc-1-like [Hyalella azteca]
MLTPEEVQKIWFPEIFFYNDDGNQFSNLGQGSRVELIAGGTAVQGGSDNSDEANIISEGVVAMSQRYNVHYSCDFDLLMFPFDAQDCLMTFELTSAAASYLMLRPDNITYMGRKDLVEYTISEFIEINSSIVSGYSQVKLGVRFERRYGFYIITQYIPTALLAVIAYFTFFFGPKEFESRMNVALTAMLVLSSLFTQVICAY